ncbi:MAG TPA: DUF4174 domain-containing protein [Tepidisphaeraceae bacterium]|jgi:hypothetical protein
MITHHWVLAAGLMAGVCVAATPTTNPSADAAVEAMRWKRRVLILFSPTSDDPALRAQRAIIKADAAGYAEREMTVVEMINDQATIDGRTVAAGELRRKFARSSDRFELVLIGKDGGVKQRETTPLASAELFATIDAMPMRKNEMR